MAARSPSSSSSASRKARTFGNAADAVAAVEEIYESGIKKLRKAFDSFAAGKIPKNRVQAFYPYIRFATQTAARAAGSRLSYGFVDRPGTYETTVTRPDLFGSYYKAQITQLLKNHGGKIEVGISETPLPIHFALGEDFHLEGGLSPEQMAALPERFDLPDLDIMDDAIANARYDVRPGEAAPLALFTAPRVDLSLMRLKHYTGTAARHFQNYVIFTNYQFYIDEFAKIAKAAIAQAPGDAAVRKDAYTAFVEPGGRVTCNPHMSARLCGEKDADGESLSRMPQMPAYHLKRKDGSGITMVNIGVGPSNAKTITDHVAVLRPHAWLMLGHCAGLRNTQVLGDYVLAHGYLREDNVLYRDLHPSIPIPALAEVQVALEQAVEAVTGLSGPDLKRVMRTGTVATVDDRNWELRAAVHQNRRFSQSRAIALDMESGTVAANGFRFRVPYGTLLCVSDKPLHGQLKLPGMADSFYRERVEQHLRIGLLAMENLRRTGPERLHSRKLRSFNEVAFQ